MRSYRIIAVIFFSLTACTSGDGNKSDETSDSQDSTELAKKPYPFGSAKVKLVSFCLNPESPEEAAHCDLEVRDSILVPNLIAQERELLPIEIDSLADILYKLCERSGSGETTKASCYTPRNAIVFFNERNKVQEFIEICFECSKMEFSNTTVTKPVECNPLYQDLNRFFTSRALKTARQN